MKTNNRVVNILFIIDSLRIGGAQELIVDILEYIDRSKYNITVCCLRKENYYTAHFEKLGIQVCQLNKYKYNLLAIYSLIKIIKRNKADIIHTHLFASNILGVIAGILCRTKIIVHDHSGISKNVLDTYFEKKLFSKLYFSVFSFLLKYVHKLIVLTKKDLNYYSDNHIIPKDNISRLPNGIDITKFNPDSQENILRKELNLNQPEKIIGTVCRFSSEKGLGYLISAANDVLAVRQDVTFVIVGDGPMKNELHKMVLNISKPQKVIFTGYRKDIPQILLCFDIFVLPSLVEAFGIAVLEAMASGVPVIATNSGGPAEIIENGVDGLLVEPRDAKQLSDKVLYLLDHPEERKTFANNALKKVIEKYDIKTIVRQLENLYESIYRKRERSKVHPLISR